MQENKEMLREIVTEAVEKIVGEVAAKFGKINLSEIVRLTQTTLNDLGVKIVEQVVRIADERYNAERNKREVVIRNIQTRHIASTLGEISLTRRLYQKRGKGGYFYAVDELLGIEKYGRIDNGLKAKLINDATLTSYGKASALSDNRVCRQTVGNLIKRIPQNGLAVGLGKVREVSELFIEADEDHIHLTDGTNAEVKLVYVHEGRRQICKGRSRLINARYFVSIGGNDIWESVRDYVYMQYDIRAARVYLSGDGANWIKAGLAQFPKAEYRIDKFHIFKSVTDVWANDEAVKRAVLDCIRQENKDALNELYDKRMREARSNAERQRVYENYIYVRNNFEFIDLSERYGCSAEGHVSHVLSARLSSRPMAWSKAGAQKMAELRAFYFNGGNFSALVRAKEEGAEESKRYSFNARHSAPLDHSITKGHIVNLDGVTDEISRALREVIRK